MANAICLVCTAPINMSNLGVDACRACAAFFKRTVSSGRKYTCRQSDRKCSIRKHEKFMCRSCRYDKCVKLGMEYDFRDKTYPKNEVGITHAVASTSFPSFSKKTSLLDRMETEYKASYDRRLTKEKDYVSKEKIKPLADPTKEFYIVNLTAFYEIYRIIISDSSMLLKNVFEDFERIPIIHRVVLFKNFVIKFSVVEWVYLTGKYFKNTNFLATSLITCSEMGNIDQWMTDEDKIEKKEDLKTTLKSFTEDFCDLFIPMLKMDQVTEREFYALALLSYCDIDNSLHLPQDIIEKVESIRAIILSELQEYYKYELKIDDFSQRLGNLMTLTHCAGEAGILMSEEMRMYTTMFDLYSDDRMFREFFTDC